MTINDTITSRCSLGVQGAFRPMFSPLPVNDTLYYDDGPPMPRTKGTAAGPSSGLSGSYAFVQGVEITQQAHYDAGTVKIWSGEPQHRHSLSVFGQDKTFFGVPRFEEADRFDPTRYIESQDTLSPIFDSLLTFPIITGDNDQIEGRSLNGIIEPFSIRPVVGFFSIDVPFEAHTSRGALMAGNTDQRGGSEHILTVYRYEPELQAIGYLDMVDIIEGHPLNGFFRHEFTSNAPFTDERLVRGLHISSSDSELVAVLSLMTGSTDSYVHHDQRSATCGWYYDNAIAGTDSLAFGGMTY